MGKRTGSRDQQERRRFPRKEAKVKVRLSASEAGRTFEAYVPSWDISIGGVFLESEFFVKTGTPLEVMFDLPDVSGTIQARGKVVREVRQAEGRKGFAIQFTEYIGDAWLALAGFFLAPEVRRFVSAYRKTGRHNRIRGEQERMVDLIVAWEMNRFEAGRRFLTT